MADVPKQPQDSVEQQELEFRRQFGLHLRRLRLETGLNQDEFAARARIHRSHIGLLENGRRDPQLTTILRVAKALGLTPAQLLDFDPVSESIEETEE